MAAREVDPLALMSSSGRFDLIFKYEFAREILGLRVGHSAREAYLSHIKAFNNFHEESPAKNSQDDFVASFLSLIRSFERDGYLASAEPIPVNRAFDPLDGAHRIGAAAAVGVPVRVEESEGEAPYDWKFFKERGLRARHLDFGGIHRSRLDQASRIFLVFPCVPTSFDDVLLEILGEKEVRPLYKKNLRLTKPGLTNLKILTYETWPNRSWIGSPTDGYSGARNHARSSNGRHPLRVFLLGNVTDLQLGEIKATFRSKVGLGNFSCHSEDDRDASRELADLLFHHEAENLLNRMPVRGEVEEIVTTMRAYENRNTLPARFREEVLIAGSSTLQLYGLRTSRDIDIAASPENASVFAPSPNIDIRSFGELVHLPASVDEMVTNDSFSFRLKGWNYITLHALSSVKNSRREWPKDIIDLFLVRLNQAAPSVKRGIQPVVAWAGRPNHKKAALRKIRESVDRLYMRAQKLSQVIDRLRGKL